MLDYIEALLGPQNARTIYKNPYISVGRLRAEGTDDNQRTYDCLIILFPLCRHPSGIDKIRPKYHDQAAHETYPNLSALCAQSSRGFHEPESSTHRTNSRNRTQDPSKHNEGSSHNLVASTQRSSRILSHRLYPTTRILSAEVPAIKLSAMLTMQLSQPIRGQHCTETSVHSEPITASFLSRG